MFVNGPSSDSYGLSAVAAPRAAGCHGHSPPSSQPTREDMGSGGGDLASAVLAVLQGLGLNVSPLTGANTPATATQATTATTAEPASTTTTAPSAPAEPAASGDMLKGDLRSFLHALIDALQNGGATAPAAAI